MDQCFQITPVFLCTWQGSGKGNSFEELQKLFVSMFSADLAAFDNSIARNCATSDKKRGASNSFPFFESPEENFAQPQNHFFGCGNDVNSSTPKKTKSNLHSNSNTTSTNNFMQFDRTCSNQWWRAAYLLLYDIIELLAALIGIFVTPLILAALGRRQFIYIQTPCGIFVTLRHHWTAGSID